MKYDNPCIFLHDHVVMHNNAALPSHKLQLWHIHTCKAIIMSHIDREKQLNYCLCVIIACYMLRQNC